jgi:hypothetical protein
MEIYVEDGKLVFRQGETTVRYTLSFIRKKIAEFKVNLDKFQEYERLLTSQSSGRVGTVWVLRAD